MKLRKFLAILLVMALSLGVAPVAGADGAEQSTTLSGSTVTHDDIPETSGDGVIKVIDDTINVRIINTQHKIAINPYGMSIAYPDDSDASDDAPNDSDTSDDSIVSVPLYIKNNTDVPVDVTATATAIPHGKVVLDSEPTRGKKDEAHTPEDQLLKEQRVYLYLQMMEWDGVSSVGKNKWDSLDKREVITKSGGSAPLTVEMPEGGGAALKIGGETSVPTYYGAWKTDGTFDVNIVLSFLPKQKEGYPVTFDVKDVFWSKGKELIYPVKIELQGVKDPKKTTLDFNKDQQAPQTVTGEESLTFTIKTAESLEGSGNLIVRIYLIHLDAAGNEIENSKEKMYPLTDEEEEMSVIEYTNTINASKVTLGETLKVKIFITPF